MHERARIPRLPDDTIIDSGRKSKTQKHHIVAFYAGNDKLDIFPDSKNIF